MEKRISIIGLVLLVIGIILIVAFWPVFGVSATNIEKNEENDFKSYDSGDKINIYGTITDISEDNVPTYLEDLGIEEFVRFELDGKVWVLVEDKKNIDYKIGDEIYCKVILDDIEFIGNTYEFWKLADDCNLKSKINLNYLFYFVAGVGTVVSAVGFVKE